MKNAIGEKLWIIPDMYWPLITSQGSYVSHESICVLNPSDTDCEITINLYFEDREPIRGLKVLCKAERTHHVRMDGLLDHTGRHLPRGVPYAAVVECSVPVVVQYTRVDTTQSENALMTTMAFPVKEPVKESVKESEKEPV